MFSRHLVCLFAVLLAMHGSAAWATDETTDPNADRLLGDVGGMRTDLVKRGIDLSAEYKGDLVAVTNGFKTGQNYLDNLDLKANLDGDKLWGVAHNKALIYLLDNNGGKPNLNRVQSLQGINNIEVNNNTFKLYEAWDEQGFDDEKIHVLAGLYDLNSEFDETDLSNNFLKPNFQIGAEFAQSGRNGPSIFPTTSLATRLLYNPVAPYYLQLGVLGGVSGNPARPYGTHINTNTGQGLLLIAEAGITPKTSENEDIVFNKFAVGVWSYTRSADDLVNVTAAGHPVQRTDDGVYLLSSYQIYKHGDRSIGPFFHLGISDGDTKPIKWAYEAGIVADGWTHQHPKSEFGFGVTQSNNAEKYETAQAALGQSPTNNEYGAEFYYRDRLYKGVSIQPDVQTVIYPGGDKTQKDAVILTTRLDVSF